MPMYQHYTFFFILLFFSAPFSVLVFQYIFLLTLVLALARQFNYDFYCWCFQVLRRTIISFRKLLDPRSSPNQIHGWSYSFGYCVHDRAPTKSISIFSKTFEL